MKRIHLTLLLSIATLFLMTAVATAQNASSAPVRNESPVPGASSIPAAPAINANSTPIELARAALAAQGGDKFKNLKSLTMYGSANLYAPNSSQSLPGKFVMVTAGDKVRIDIDASPVFKFKQVYDGQQSFSNMPGMSLPPPSKFGLPVLAKYDQPGYTVSALPNDKKLRGFRIADTEGNTTDFFVDVTTARVIKYLIPYNGYTFGTENSKFQEYDGVLVPISFSQRLETPQGAFFAEYKVKEVKVNETIADDVFTIQ